MFSVKKINLIIITGIVWTVVSFLLIRRAISWYPEFSQTEAVLSIISGLVLAFVKTYFIFIKVTNENIDRIMTMSRQKISVFEMHTVKLFILILLMIGSGAILRNIEYVPKYTLFPIYLGVGLAMFYTSILYFRYFFRFKFKPVNSNKES